MQTRAQLKKFAAYPEILRKLAICSQSSDRYHTEIVKPAEAEMKI
jgi:hypothetical protein